MSLPHALSRLSVAIVIAAGLVVSPPLASSATAVEVLHDGGFEETVPETTHNPWWEGFDSDYPQGPLCRTDNYCGDGGGGEATARSGVGWVWLGEGSANQTGWVRQTVVIPAGYQATLRYWYRFPTVTAPFDATLTVSLAGTVVATHHEPDVPQGDYVHHSVDVSAFADGGQHVLEFAYAKASDPSPAWTDLNIDDVSLDAVDATAPETSVSVATVQDGVARSLTVPVGFTSAEPSSTFTCSLDGAPYAACTSPAQLTVGSGRHTFRVVARDAAGNADQTPAVAAFTAYDCPTLKSAVVKHRSKVHALKRRLVTTRADLREAWRSHDHEAADRLQTKVHRIEHKRKAQRQALFQARKAYAPCLYS